MNKAKISWLKRVLGKERNPHVQAMLIYQILKEAEENEEN